MPSLTDNVRSLRARPIRFVLEGGRSVSIPPPTLGQVAQILQLDPDPARPETAKEELLRFAEQARIILGPEHAALVDSLNRAQIAEIVGALYVAATGMDPEAYVRWQQLQRKAGTKIAAMTMLENIERLIVDISAQLRKTPAEVESIPLADAQALRDRIQTLERERINVQALIAGRELTWS